MIHACFHWKILFSQAILYCSHFIKVVVSKQTLKCYKTAWYISKGSDISVFHFLNCLGNNVFTINELIQNFGNFFIQQYKFKVKIKWMVNSLFSNLSTDMILKNLHITLLSCIVQSSVKLYTCIFFLKTYACDKNVSIFIQKVTCYFCTMFIPYFDIFWFITNSYIYIVQNLHIKELLLI